MAINIGFKRLTIQPFKKGKFPLEKRRGSNRH